MTAAESASTNAVTGQQNVGSPPMAADDPVARLEKLKGLLDKSLISQAEFDGAKAEVLKRLVG